MLELDFRAVKFFVLPSTGFEPTPLIHCSTNRLAFCYPIQYIKNCLVRLLLNYNIKYICTIYTRLDTCLMSISRFSLRDKVTLRLLKLYFYIANVVENEEFIIQSQEKKYIIQISKQVTTIQYICPTRSQSYL
jgi:hypothetical protein